MNALKLELMGLPADTILTDDQKYYGIEFNPASLTMVSYDRLTNLEVLIADIVKQEIEGDLIETGVWRGGASIFMAKMLQQLKSDKCVIAADSFEGLPKPDDSYPHDKGDYHYNIDYLSVSVTKVASNFLQHDCLDKVKFVKGWFKDTLHLLDNKFSLIRLDGDMYESTINALDALYPKLSTGGYCIIDDYNGVPQCPIAVNDYRRKHNITDEIITIDNTGVYWKKTC